MVSAMVWHIIASIFMSLQWFFNPGTKGNDSTTYKWNGRVSALLVFGPLCSVTQIYLAPNTVFGMYADLLLQARPFRGRNSSEVLFSLALNFYSLLKSQTRLSKRPSWQEGTVLKTGGSLFWPRSTPVQPP